MNWSAICGFRLVVADLAASVRFFAAIGFSAGDTIAIDADEMRLLRLDGRGERMRLTLGRGVLELDCFDEPGAAYPADADAADPCFQHFAIVTSDAQAAWHSAQAVGAKPISRGGPITLPASSGGVTAVKFRDPDGHPLEFLQFPAGANPDWHGEGVLGIDHSAISVTDLDAARAFYADAGLKEGKGSLNHGSTQVALDGLDHVRVAVVPMQPASLPPHLELLAYRQPRPKPRAPWAVNDICATRIVWKAGREALLRDPDGHLHQLTR